MTEAVRTTAPNPWEERLHAVSAAGAKYLWIIVIFGITYWSLDTRLLSPNTDALPFVNVPIVDVAFSPIALWATGPAVLFFLILVLLGAMRAYHQSAATLTSETATSSEQFDTAPNAIDLAVYTTSTAAPWLMSLLRFTYPAFLSLFWLEAVTLLRHLWRYAWAVPSGYLLCGLGVFLGGIGTLLLLRAWLLTAKAMMFTRAA